MTQFINDVTDKIVTSEIKKDIYNFRKMDRSIIDYYIDLGANHGLVYNSLIFNGWSFKKSILLEPLEYNFDILKQNVLASDVVSLNKMCFGIDDQPQQLSFFKSNSSGATQFAYSDGAGDTTSSATLQMLVDTYNIDSSKVLLKIDCEGAEKYLLANDNLEVAKRCPYITGEFHTGTKTFIDMLYTHMKKTHSLTYKGLNFFISLL